jgi:hypothetical protein
MVYPKLKLNQNGTLPEHIRFMIVNSWESIFNGENLYG